MKVDDVVPAFLAACPTIKPAWDEYLRTWDYEADRGHFNDIGVIAHHLVDSLERRELSEFPAAFELLERCLIEGDEQVRELLKVGLIEDIQNVGSHRSLGPKPFHHWLGQLSEAAWHEVEQWWEQLREVKAAGELQTQSPPKVPGDIHDPALRRMIERIYRK